MTKQFEIKYIFSALVIMTSGLVAGCDTASGGYSDGNSSGNSSSNNDSNSRGDDGDNFAEVTAVKAITSSVNVPREECHDEVVTISRETRDPDQIAGTVAGAVIGGVIGSQIGGGKGKTAATAGGVLAGGYAGNKVQEGMQERNTYQETQQKCVTVNDTQQEAAGYEVTYLFNGVERTVNMDYDPGERIAVVDGILQINN